MSRSKDFLLVTVKYDTLFMCLKFEESMYFGGQNVICFCAVRIISTNHWKNANKKKQKQKQIDKQTNKKQL